MVSTLSTSPLALPISPGQTVDTGVLCTDSFDLRVRRLVQLADEALPRSLNLRTYNSVSACRDSLALSGTSLCLIDDEVGNRDISRSIRGIRDVNPHCACVVLTDSMDPDLHKRYAEYGAAEILLWQDTADLSRSAFTVSRALRSALHRTLLEAELKAMSQRHEFAWRNSPAPFFKIEGAGHVLACNQPFAELLGYDSPNELMGVPLLEVDRSPSPKVFPFRPKNSGSMRTCRLRKKDGDSVQVQLIDQVSPGQHRELDTLVKIGGPRFELPVREGFVAVQGSAELELRRQLSRYEAIYNSLFSAMAEGFIIADARGRVSACNVTAEATLGLRLKEVQGKHVDDVLLFESCDDESIQHFSQVYDGRERVFKIRRCRNSPNERGGPETVWIRCKATLVAIPGAKSVIQRSQFLISIIDVTAQLEAEQRCDAAEARSRITAGVSHDMRNYLTAIAASAGLLKTTLHSEDPALKEYAEQIEEAALGSAQLLDQVVRVGQGEAPTQAIGSAERAPISVAATVAGIERLLTSLLGKNIQLELIPPASDDTILAEATAIEQVVINLVLNASQALEESRSGEGRIEISTAALLLGEDNEYAVGPGRYILLSVRDNGPGISDEMQQRMFEPFATDRASGSGLGLSMVKESVQHRLGGGIACTTKTRSPMGQEETPQEVSGEVEDWGTTFRIAIPARSSASV